MCEPLIQNPKLTHAPQAPLHTMGIVLAQWGALEKWRLKWLLKSSVDCRAEVDGLGSSNICECPCMILLPFSGTLLIQTVGALEDGSLNLDATVAQATTNLNLH